jgi:hypothetical protein
MPEKSDENEVKTERILTTIDNLRLAYYGKETDNPWRDETRKNVIQSWAKDLEEYEIENIERDVNTALENVSETPFQQYAGSLKGTSLKINKDMVKKSPNTRDVNRLENRETLQKRLALKILKIMTVF